VDAVLRFGRPSGEGGKDAAEGLTELRGRDKPTGKIGSDFFAGFVASKSLGQVAGAEGRLGRGGEACGHYGR